LHAVLLQHACPLPPHFSEDPFEQETKLIDANTRIGRVFIGFVRMNRNGQRDFSHATAPLFLPRSRTADFRPSAKLTQNLIGTAEVARLRNDSVPPADRASLAVGRASHSQTLLFFFDSLPDKYLLHLVHAWRRFVLGQPSQVRRVRSVRYFYFSDR
jgi:hypothetical protein